MSPTELNRMTRALWNVCGIGTAGDGTKILVELQRIAGAGIFFVPSVRLIFRTKAGTLSTLPRPIP
jgi:hypothetical protein